MSTVAYLDTNIFLHFKDLKEIDWTGYFDASEVNLVVAHTVIQELDRKKYNGRTVRIRKRAAKTLAEFKALGNPTQKHEIRPSVFLSFDSLVFEDYSKYHLCSTDADDGALLNALHYVADQPDARVYIIAHDFGFQTKGWRFSSIQVIDPPVDWKLAPEKDSVEEELQKLQQQLAERTPILEVTFGNDKTFEEFRLSSLPPSGKSVVDQVMRNVRLAAPKLGERAKLQQLIDNASINVEKFNEAIDRYYERYEKILPVFLERAQQRARTIKLELVLHNTGKAPAKDVKVSITVPKNLILLNELPDVPRLPKAPVRDDYRPFGSISRPGILDPFISKQQQVDLFGKDTGEIVGNTINFELGKAQHNGRYQLPAFYVEFQNRLEAKGFNIAGTIVSDELPDPVSVKLQTKVSGADSGVVMPSIFELIPS